MNRLQRPAGRELITLKGFLCSAFGDTVYSMPKIPIHTFHYSFMPKRLISRVAMLFCCALALLSAACTTLRVTSPPETADEQYLLSDAASKSIARLTVSNLRDRRVFVDAEFLDKSIDQQKFLVADLRAHLLAGGVRLVNTRAKAQIVLEVRCAALGINNQSLLVGIPPVYATSTPTSGLGYIPVLIPEIALFKNIHQKGYASVAYVAYWRKTGDIVASSGPFVGRTYRSDWWIFGFGPQTSGNIPPAQQP